MKPIFYLLAPAMVLAVAFNSAAQSKTGLAVLNRFAIAGSGGWDYLTVDADAKLIYVSHGTQVNIITTKGDSAGVIANTNGVHGIGIAKKFGKGYTSNGRSNNATVFNLSDFKPLKQVTTGTNPDAIFFDPFSEKVFVFNGKSMDATVIDPATDEVVATIPIGGKPETGVSDHKGHVFVNSETTNEVVVIDSKTLKVTNRYKINDGDEPSGLAMDIATGRLFIGCGGNQTMVIMDAYTGKNLAKFKIGDCDGVAFDDKLKNAYSSNAEGTMSVVHEVNKDKFIFVENIITDKSARTIALDPLTHRIYLSAAKTEAVAPTAATPNPRPRIVPGSFHVIEIGTK